MIVLAAISLAFSSEALIILSNLILALSTFLLFWASMREQHQTIQTITKANGRMVRRLVGLVKGSKPSDSD